MAKGKTRVKSYEPGTLAFFAILGVVLISLGAVSLLAVVGGLKGAFFDSIKRVMQGLGGGLCVGASVLTVWGGLIVAFSSGRGMPKRAFFLICVIYLAVLGIVNLLSKWDIYDYMEYVLMRSNSEIPPPVDAGGYWSMIKTGFAVSAETGMFGGALGMLLGWLAWQLGPIIGTVVLAFVCLICVVIFSHFDVQGLFHGLRERSEERAREKEAQRNQLAYQQMLEEQQRQVEEAERLRLTPAYTRRKGRQAEQPAQPMPAMPPVYPPFGSMVQPPYPAQPMQPAFAPGAAQPEMYDELVTSQTAQPLWPKRGAKPKKGDKQAATAAYQTRMTFTPSEVGAQVAPTADAATPGGARILSTSKSKALEKIEEIRRRKAELSMQLDGDPAQEQEGAPDDMILPPIAQDAPPVIDRASAYKRPEQQRESPADTAAPVSYAPATPVAPKPAPPRAAAPQPAERPQPIPYTFPSIDLLNLQQKKPIDTRAIDMENAKKLEKTLESFSIPARVQRVTHGPAVTRFELGLVSSGVNVKRILSIADNIALDMAANGGVRIEIPIPGTNLFGIEVPNTEIQAVSLAEVLTSPEMQAAKSPLAVALGRDITGKPIICDLARMPHLLIAGQTGSGKSVCINSIINSLLFRSAPDEVRMIMIDPKVVELQCYNVVPHLLIPVVSDPHKAAGALAWAVAEMLDRYHKMQSKNAREISAYNAKLGPDEQKMPRIVIIIDELADLMLACKKEVEESIIRLAQLARAAGIHMVVATQRPTVDVITGLIKSNVPSRIAFAVSSNIDSRTILDEGGAEKLLGRGDMLYMPTGVKPPKRVQGCYLSDAETERVVNYIAEHSHVDFDPNVIEAMESDDEIVNPLDDGGEDGGLDERLAEAIDMVITDGQASISMLQRRMKIGYARAGRLIDDMAARGIVSKSVGSKPREILMSREEYERLKDSLLGK